MYMSILYHAFGIKGVTYRFTYYLGNAVFFHVKTTDHHVPCPKCNHRLCIFSGHKARWLRMPPIDRKQAILDLKMHRLQCKQCDHLWWPRLSFMQGTARYPRSFALTVLDLLCSWTIRAVAQYFHVSWDVVKEIHKSRLVNNLLPQSTRLPDEPKILETGVAHGILLNGLCFGK